MQFSELDLKKSLKKAEFDIEERIKFDILNFIHCIYLNKENFINSSYGSEYFGDLPMTFKKNAGQVFGVITVKINNEERIYVFNDRGYECLDDLMKL